MKQSFRRTGGEGTQAFFAGLPVNLALLVVSVLFFALPQPNFLNVRGFPLIAYVAFVPLFILVRRVSFRASFVWGALYGTLCYCLFTYWLAVFHPLAMYIIAILYCLWCMAVLPLLKAADSLFPRRGFIVQWIIWIGYEYLKTRGFNGYSYGIIGYSQWSFPLISGIASIFGVWGVSALVVFPSAWLAGGIKESCTGKIATWTVGFTRFAREHRLSAVIWFIALVGTLIYSALSWKDYDSLPQVSLALIQPNSDPWLGGMEAYRRDYLTLTRLSDEALKARPDIDMVVWPETAFIPRIDWHYRYREDREAFDLVSSLLAYLDRSPVPFVLGNDDAVAREKPDGSKDRLDYNAVFVFEPGKNVLPPRPHRYRKMHLVPFTEHFPYRKAFPWVYTILLENDTHFWEKGKEATVFSVGDLSFSTPICFEDTFGYISRRFVNNGARAIVNLTNDAWAKSESSQWQHMSMAVFRAVENRVPLVRATASGQTCYVDPNGVVRLMASSFTQSWIVADVPVIKDLETTPYRLWGDIMGILAAMSAITVIIAGLLTRLRHI